MGNKKTNIEYLRDIIDMHIGQANKDEALEFLESIETDQSELKDEIKDLEDKLEYGDDDEPEYDCEIDVRMGANDNLYWKCNNMAGKQMMEELGEAIGRGIPLLKIENVLRAL